MALSDLLGVFTGLLLTLFVFSYLLGDNALFRIAIHIFIGVVTAYLVVMICVSVIWPQVILPFFSGDPNQWVVVIVPLVMGLLLLTKAWRRFSGLGTPVAAFLVGVGAAVAVGGAVTGTIFPQSLATINLFDLRAIQAANQNVPWEVMNGGIVLVGVVSSLIYFHFGVRASSSGVVERAAWIEAIARLGQVFIAIAFGVTLAGVYSAALAALIERWQFIVNLILSFLQP